MRKNKKVFESSIVSIDWYSKPKFWKDPFKLHSKKHKSSLKPCQTGNITNNTQINEMVETLLTTHKRCPVEIEGSEKQPSDKEHMWAKRLLLP